MALHRLLVLGMPRRAFPTEAIKSKKPRDFYPWALLLIPNVRNSGLKLGADGDRQLRIRRYEFAFHHLEQLRDAKLVHARPQVVRFGTQRLVHALRQADRDDAGRLAFGVGRGALFAQLHQQLLNLVELFALLERGEFDLMTTVQPVLWRALEEPKKVKSRARAKVRARPTRKKGT